MVNNSGSFFSFFEVVDSSAMETLLDYLEDHFYDIREDAIRYSGIDIDEVVRTTGVSEDVVTEIFYQLIHDEFKKRI